MWGEFAVDYFACSMRIIQHTPGGLGAPFFSSKSPCWVTEEFTISVFTIWGESQI